MGLPKTTLNPPQHPGNLTDERCALGRSTLGNGAADTEPALKERESQLDGLSPGGSRFLA